MLKSIEGIVQLLTIETGKPELNIVFDMQNYIARQKEQHNSREEITIARQYLCEQIMNNKYLVNK